MGDSAHQPLVLPLRQTLPGAQPLCGPLAMQTPGWEAEGHVVVGHTPLSSPPLAASAFFRPGCSCEARDTLVLSVPAHRALPHQPPRQESLRATALASRSHSASKGTHCSMDTATGRDRTEKNRATAAWELQKYPLSLAHSGRIECLWGPPKQAKQRSFPSQSFNP